MKPVLARLTFLFYILQQYYIDKLCTFFIADVMLRSEKTLVSPALEVRTAAMLLVQVLRIYKNRIFSRIT
jgi:hypothetical protein